MADQDVQRPPASGPGSGVAAWREYAAAVTKSPAESWAQMSREDIIELLDSEGADPQPAADPDAEPDAEVDPEVDPDQPVEPVEPARPRRPEWMVPTATGPVPERTLRGR